MTRTIITFAMLGVLAAACGTVEPGTASSDTTTPPLAAPDEIWPILTIADEGGFVPVEWNFRRVPRYVLMSDGTMYGPGAVPAIYPGPALPAIQTLSISEAAMAEIMTLIEDSGLAEVIDERNDEGMLTVADVTDTVIVYVDDQGNEHRFSVYALGFDGVEYKDERIAPLESLVARVELAAMEGDSQPDPYIASEVDVFAGVREIGVDPQFQNTLDWPLEVAYSEMAEAGAGFRCSHLVGSPAAEILDLFGNANDATTFTTTEGSEYTLIVRPLLPGQASAC